MALYCKAGSYWLSEVSQSAIGGHWRSTQINPRSVYIIKEALWDGMDGWDWIVIVLVVGHRYSKSTIEANK